MALKGVKVVEIIGLAPAPLCGMILAEFGADVITVDKINQAPIDYLRNGKKSISIDLKQAAGASLFRKLSKQSDVVIEPFRPQVMEKLGLGPKVLLKDNPKLIYARLTGYGQDGNLAMKAGHDINYIAISGVLSFLRKEGESPRPPMNIGADFAGGSLMCALGIAMSLYERTISGKGQVVDASMVEGIAYTASWIFRTMGSPIKGLLDGSSPFYQTYETKDQKYMAVGALEPQFFKELLRGLNLENTNINQFGDFDEQRQLFTKIFLSKTQKEWTEIFKNFDACVTPVLDMDNVTSHPHNVDRKSFTKTDDGLTTPIPAPRLGRTPGVSLASTKAHHHGEHTEGILLSLGYSRNEINKLRDDGVVHIYNKSHL